MEPPPAVLESLGPDGFGGRPMNADDDEVKDDGTLKDNDADDMNDHQKDGFQGNLMDAAATPSPRGLEGPSDERRPARAASPRCPLVPLRQQPVDAGAPPDS